MEWWLLRLSAKILAYRRDNPRGTLGVSRNDLQAFRMFSQHFTPAKPKKVWSIACIKYFEVKRALMGKIIWFIIVIKSCLLSKLIIIKLIMTQFDLIWRRTFSKLSLIKNETAALIGNLLINYVGCFTRKV